METITFRTFKKEPKHYANQVTNDFEPIKITRKNGQNAVLITEAEYNNLIENQYILSNPENLTWLQQSLAQIKHRKSEKPNSHHE